MEYDHNDDEEIMLTTSDEFSDDDVVQLEEDEEDEDSFYEDKEEEEVEINTNNNRYVLKKVLGTHNRFASPYDMCVDTNQELLFVCDSGNSSISVFDLHTYEWKYKIDCKPDIPFYIEFNPEDSTILFGSNDGSLYKYSVFGKLIWKISRAGSTSFNLPSGIAIDFNSSGRNIYLCDQANHRILVLTSNGDYITEFGKHGKGNLEFIQSRNICFANDGNLIITDRYNHRVQIITKDGKFVKSFGRRGHQAGEFNEPCSICVEKRTGNIYVSDSFNDSSRVIAITTHSNSESTITDNRFNLLIKWLREVEHAEVNDNLFQIKKLDDFGQSLVATKDIKQNTILFKLKQDLLLDSKFVFEKLFKHENAKSLDVLKRLQEGDLSIFNAMVLMIIHLFKVAQSNNEKFDTTDVTKFIPYISSLPRPFHGEGPKVAFLFGGEELNLLKGSTLLPSALTRRQSIANSFQKIVMPLMKDLKVIEPIRNSSSYSLGLFEHFVSLSWSRIHSIYDYRIKSDRSCFVPLGDIINFSKTGTNLISYTDKVTNELIFKTSKRVKAGSQLFVKYGKLTPTLNHILMMDYGFCPLDDPEIEFLNNTITVIDMRESVMSRMSNVDKKLNNQRVRLLSMTSLDEYHLTQTLYYNDDSFNLVEHTLSEIFDPNIIAIMRILACDQIEIKALSDVSNSLAPLDQKRDMIAKLLINPISDRNEYVVIEIIRGLIRQRLENIKEMMRENEAFSGNFPIVTMSQKCAYRYIQSEKKILEIYLKILTPPIFGKDEL